jgi:hypothetical protein
VNEGVREAAKRLADIGAILEWIWIPAHLTAAAVWTPIGTEGMTQTMIYGDGYGLSRSDLYSTPAGGRPSRLARSGGFAVRNHKDAADAWHLREQQIRCWR